MEPLNLEVSEPSKGTALDPLIANVRSLYTHLEKVGDTPAFKLLFQQFEGVAKTLIAEAKATGEGMAKSLTTALPGANPFREFTEKVRAGGDEAVMTVRAQRQKLQAEYEMYYSMGTVKTAALANLKNSGISLFTDDKDRLKSAQDSAAAVLAVEKSANAALLREQIEYQAKVAAVRDSAGADTLAWIKRQTLIATANPVGPFSVSEGASLGALKQTEAYERMVQVRAQSEAMRVAADKSLSAGTLKNVEYAQKNLEQQLAVAKTILEASEAGMSARNLAERFGSKAVYRSKHLGPLENKIEREDLAKVQMQLAETLLAQELASAEKLRAFTEANLLKRFQLGNELDARLLAEQLANQAKLSAAQEAADLARAVRQGEIARRFPSGQFSVSEGAGLGNLKGPASVPGAEELNKHLAQTPGHAGAAGAAVNALSLNMQDAHSFARGLAGSLNALWLTYGSVAPLLAGALLAGSIRQVVVAGKELEYQLTFVSALTNGAAISTDKFAEAMKGSQQTTKEGALGLRALAQAGLDADQALAVLPSVMTLATVGEMSLASAALTATGIMHAFGLELYEIPKIVDVLTKSAAISNTSVSEMGEAMKQASVVADQYHVSLQEVSAGLVVLATRNITGSSAGTSIKNMEQEIAAPSEKAALRIKQLKLEFYDAEHNLISFKDQVLELKRGLVGLSEQSKNEAVNDIFGKKGEKAIAALVKDTALFLKTIDTVTNEAQRFAEKVKADLGGTVQGQLNRTANELSLVFDHAFEKTGDAWSNLVQRLSVGVKSDGFQGFIDLLTTGSVMILKNVDTLAVLAAAVYAGNIAWGVLTATQAVAITTTALATAASAASTASQVVATAAAADLTVATTAQTVATTALTLAKTEAAAATVGLSAAWAAVAWPLAIVTALGAAYFYLRDGINAAKEAEDRKNGASKEFNARMDDQIKKVDLESKAKLLAARTNIEYADALKQVTNATKLAEVGSGSDNAAAARVMKADLEVRRLRESAGDGDNRGGRDKRASEFQKAMQEQREANAMLESEQGRHNTATTRIDQLGTAEALSANNERALKVRKGAEELYKSLDDRVTAGKPGLSGLASGVGELREQLDNFKEGDLEGLKKFETTLKSLKKESDGLLTVLPKPKKGAAGNTEHLAGIKALHDNELQQIQKRFASEMSLITAHEANQTSVMAAMRDARIISAGEYNAREIGVIAASEADKLARIAKNQVDYKAQYDIDFLNQVKARDKANSELRSKDPAKIEAKRIENIAASNQTLVNMANAFKEHTAKNEDDAQKIRENASKRLSLMLLKAEGDYNHAAKAAEDFWRADALNQQKLARQTATEDLVRGASPNNVAYLQAAAAERETWLSLITDFNTKIREQEREAAGAKLGADSLIGKSGWEEANETVRVTLRLLQQTRDEKAKIEGLIPGKVIEAGTRAAVKQAKDEIEGLSKSVAGALVDSLLDGSRGRSAGKKLRDIVVKALSDPITLSITALINPIVGSIYGALGLGSGNIAGGSGGGLLGMASNAYSLSGALSGYSNGVNTAAGFLGAGATSGASALSLGYGNTVGALGGDGLGAMIAANGSWGGVSGAATVAELTGVATASEVAAGGALFAESIGGYAVALEAGTGAATALTAAATAAEIAAAGGVAATASGGAAVGGAAAGGAAVGLAAVPVVGWVALFALAAYAMFSGGDGPKLTNAGNASASFDANSKMTDYQTHFGGSNKATDGVIKGLQDTYRSSAQGLGIGTVATSFSYGGNIMSDGKDPNFALGGSAGGKKFYQGETKLDDAALQLASARAVFAALQGSELPKFISGVFDGVTASTATKEQLTSVLQTAQAYKALADQLRDLPILSLKDISYATANALVEASGGMQKFQANLSTFSDKFYSEAEKTTTTTLNLYKTFSDLNLVMPGTRDEFKSLVNANIALGESGAPTVAALLGVAGAFDAVTTYAENLAKEAIQKAKERQGLQDKLDLAMGKTTQREISLRNDLEATKDEGIKSLIKEAYAKEDAVKIAKESLGWQDKLDLSLEKTTQREISLRNDLEAASNDTIKNLIRQTYAQEDAAAAIKKASDESLAYAKALNKLNLDTKTTAASDALSSVGRSVKASQTAAEAIFNARTAALVTVTDTTKASLDAVEKSVSNLKSLSGTIKSTLDGLRPINSEKEFRVAAQKTVRDTLAKAKAGGGLPVEGDAKREFEKALQTISNPSEQLFSSFVDYARDFYKTSNDISALGKITDSQLTADEASLEALKAQTETLKGQDKTLKDGFDKEKKSLDDILSNAKDQLDAANGINLSIVSLSESLATFNKTILALTAERAKQDLPTSRGVEYSPAQIVSAVKTSLQQGFSVNDIYKGAAEKLGISPTKITDATDPYGVAGFTKQAELLTKKVDYSDMQIASAIRASLAQGFSVADVYIGAGKNFGISSAEIARIGHDSQIPGFAVGTNYVPQDMLARIHEGEAIVPKAYNPAAGGGGQNNDDVVRELQANREELAALRAEVRAAAVHAAKTAKLLDTATEGGRAMLTEAFA